MLITTLAMVLLSLFYRTTISNNSSSGNSQVAAVVEVAVVTVYFESKIFRKNSVDISRYTGCLSAIGLYPPLHTVEMSREVLSSQGLFLFPICLYLLMDGAHGLVSSVECEGDNASSFSPKWIRIQSLPTSFLPIDWIQRASGF